MKIRKNNIYTVAIIAIILLAVFFYIRPLQGKSQKPEENAEKKDEIGWMVDKSGYLYYPLDRGAVKFRRENYDETGNLTISRITYQSRNINIYGLLVLPKEASELLPGVVLLPGAGVSKESELELAMKIAEL